MSVQMSAITVLALMPAYFMISAVAYLVSLHFPFWSSLRALSTSLIVTLGSFACWLVLWVALPLPIVVGGHVDD